MKFVKLDQLRRKVMHRLTKGMGDDEAQLPTRLKNKQEIKRILVSRPNHRLGNLLMVTPLFQELEETFPTAKIDFFTKGGLAPIVLKNYENVDKIISLPKKHFHHFGGYIAAWFKVKFKKYDLVINTNGGSSSGRLSTKLAQGTYKIFGDIEENRLAAIEGYKHMAKSPVYLLRDWLGDPERTVETPVASLNVKTNTEEIASAQKILQKLVDPAKKTIAIFTYATGAKCYSKAWWAKFYQLLQENFPDHNILEVLPKENVSQIDFKAPTYYSKDIREICAFIANTEVFIGADSGMMHLAIASQTPTVGLFSVTKLDKYGPYNAQNVAIDTNTTSQEENMQTINQIIQQKNERI